MKIALCTTTIHVPHALKLMREIGPDVRFFVAGDKKTPTEAMRASVVDANYETAVARRFRTIGSAPKPSAGTRWPAATSLSWKRSNGAPTSSTAGTTITCR